MAQALSEEEFHRMQVQHRQLRFSVIYHTYIISSMCLGMISLVKMCSLNDWKMWMVILADRCPVSFSR